jgi:hypothetical protein
MAWVGGKRLVGIHREDVGEQQLLRESGEEDGRSFREVRGAHAPFRQLQGDVAIANDWARDELREQRDVEPVVDDVALRRGLAPVDVDEIRDRVESEERDAEQQAEWPDRNPGDAEPAEGPVEIVQREECVLRNEKEM